VDGVFMGKIVRRIGCIAIVVILFNLYGILMDSNALQSEIVRLHVVANSDSEEDQAVKLQVRDAVLETLRQGMQNVTDVEAAQTYLEENLPKIRQAAQNALKKAGYEDTVLVQLTDEAFPAKDYDTFSLPAGVYHALRIVIGEGNGHNWWCVVFPDLCYGATTDNFQDIAASSGFSETLTKTLAGEEKYEVRFFLLDCLGELRNFFHS
jgi:stage II sporulation protein R